MCNDLTSELVSRALDGDSDAQKLLVERLTPEIHFNVAKMLRRWRTGSAAGRQLSQEIEDLVQEVFVELWQNDSRVLRRWEPAILPLHAYVGYIAKRRAAQILRSPRSQWREEPSQIEELDRNDPGRSPEDKSSASNLLEMVLLCLFASFSPDDFRLFKLLIHERCTPKEAAEKTGKTLDAVYKWRSRLYQRARKCLDLLSKKGS